MTRIPPFRLIPQPIDDEAREIKGFNWAGGEIGTRHQLGGTPTLMTVGEYPRCSECGELMSFYAQLDSINDDYCIADCGMICVFICLDCYTTHAMVRSH